MNNATPLSPLRHPDTVRGLLYGLHTAANDHRLIHEYIDARVPGSREAARILYMQRVEAVAKAIESLQTMQDRLRWEALGREDAAINAAITAELAHANIQAA